MRRPVLMGLLAVGALVGYGSAFGGRHCDREGGHRYQDAPAAVSSAPAAPVYAPAPVVVQIPAAPVIQPPAPTVIVIPSAAPAAPAATTVVIPAQR